MTGLRCRVAVAAEEDIDALISRMNRLEHAVSDAVQEEEDVEGEAEITELHESADDAPVIKLVHSVLAQAVNEGASDIHFEAEENEMRVRFRVDGVLYESARVPKRMIAGVVSRVKLMARHGHRREADPPGRPRERHRRRPQGRPPRDHAADAAWGGGVDPHPRQGAGPSHTRRARHGRRAAASEIRVHGAAPVRCGARDRPDRFGQVDDPLRGAAGAERGRAKHHHDRGPGRVPDGGHQPDERQPQGGADLRHRAALDPPRRSRRDHGRRDPRRRDGADRDRVGAHRPHGPDDAPHERRPGCDRTPGRRWASRAS